MEIPSKPTYCSKWPIERVAQYVVTAFISLSLFGCNGSEAPAGSTENPSTQLEPVNQQVTSVDELLNQVWIGPTLDTPPNKPSVNTFISVEVNGRLWRRQEQLADDGEKCYPQLSLLGQIIRSAEGSLKLEDPVTRALRDIFLSEQTLLLTGESSSIAYRPSAEVNTSALLRPCSGEDNNPRPTPSTDLPPGGQANTDFSAYAGNWRANGGQLFGPSTDDPNDLGLITFSSNGDFIAYNYLGDSANAIADCYIEDERGTIIQGQENVFFKINAMDNSSTRFEILREGNVLTIVAGGVSQTSQRSEIDAGNAPAICQNLDDFLPQNEPLTDISQIAGVWDMSIQLDDERLDTRYLFVTDNGEVTLFDFRADSAADGEACYLRKTDIVDLRVVENQALEWREIGGLQMQDAPSLTSRVFLINEMLVVANQRFSRILPPSELSSEDLTAICADGSSRFVPSGARPIVGAVELTGQWLSFDPLRDSNTYLEIDSFGYLSSYRATMTGRNDCFLSSVERIRLEPIEANRFSVKTEISESDILFFILQDRLYADPQSVLMTRGNTGLDRSEFDPSSLVPSCTVQAGVPAEAFQVNTIEEITGIWDMSVLADGSPGNTRFLSIGAEGQIANFIRTKDPQNRQDECFIERTTPSLLTQQDGNIFTIATANGFAQRIRAYLNDGNLILSGNENELLINNPPESYWPVAPDDANFSPICPNIGELPAVRDPVTDLDQIATLWDASSSTEDGEVLTAYVEIDNEGTMSLFELQENADGPVQNCYLNRLTIGSLTLVEDNIFSLTFTDQGTQNVQAFIIEGSLALANDELLLHYAETTVNRGDINPICPF